MSWESEIRFQICQWTVRDPGHISSFSCKTRGELHDLERPRHASLHMLISALSPVSDPEEIFLCLFSKNQCTCQRPCYILYFSHKACLIENIYYLTPIYRRKEICSETTARVFLERLIWERWPRGCFSGSEWPLNRLRNWLQADQKVTWAESFLGLCWSPRSPRSPWSLTVLVKGNIGC